MNVISVPNFVRLDADADAVAVAVADADEEKLLKNKTEEKKQIEFLLLMTQ